MRDHVIVGQALAGVNERQVIHHGRDIGEDLGDPCSGLPVLFEAEWALHQRPGIALANFDLAFSLHRHAVVLLQRRLVLKGVQVADAAAHEQRDHGLCTRLEVRRLGEEERISDTGGA